MTADLDSPGSLATQELAALEELAALKARLAKIRGKGVAGYYNDPVGFMNNCVKFRKDQGLAPYQVEIIGDLPRVKRIAVRGPRGLGKSCLASMVVLWFAVTRDAVGRDWKIATTAGSWAQLTDYLWPEISKWANNLNWTAIGREPFSPRIGTDEKPTQAASRPGAGGVSRQAPEDRGSPRRQCTRFARRGEDHLPRHLRLDRGRVLRCRGWLRTGSLSLWRSPPPASPPGASMTSTPASRA